MPNYERHSFQKSMSAADQAQQRRWILTPMEKGSRKAIVTDVHRAEARALREIWDRHKPNQAEFGREFGIGGQTAVSNFLRGKSALSMKAATGFATGLGCDIGEFSPRLAREASHIAEVVAASDPSNPSEFVPVRRVDVRFSNGHGQVIYTEDDHPPLVFRRDFLNSVGIRNGDAVVVEAEGVSNEPKIMDGSAVLVNRGDRERLAGDFFAFRVDGELMIKRLERIDGVGILATAENSSFRPKSRVYTKAEDFEIIGRAVWVGSLL